MPLNLHEAASHRELQHSLTDETNELRPVFEQNFKKNYHVDYITITLSSAIAAEQLGFHGDGVAGVEPEGLDGALAAKQRCQQRIEVATEFLDPIIKKITESNDCFSILDAGCGDGVHALVLSERVTNIFKGTSKIRRFNKSSTELKSRHRGGMLRTHRRTSDRLNQQADCKAYLSVM